MSLHYLLDGYNISKQIPQWSNKSLEDERVALIRWLNANQPQGSSNNEVTVVFDGKPDMFSGQNGGAVRIVFSQQGSADDLIKDMVESATNKKNIVVVSDDREIVIYVRTLGANVLSVAAFMGSKGQKRSGSKGSSKPSSGKYITLAGQDKINKELSKLWLKNDD